MRGFLEKKARWLLVGREFSLLDKLIYSLSNKQSSGWVIGNKLRSGLYGRIKGKSNVPLVIIGGYPRSGTTLLEILIEQHPDIASPEREVNIFQDIKTKEILRENFGLNESEIKNFGNFEKNIVEYSDKMLEHYLKKKEKKIVLLKQPKHIFFLKEIFKHFTKVRFIHIIRDPGDATMSQRYYLLPQNKKEWPYEWCCRQWVTCINRGKKFRKNKRYLEIKYEDLLREPSKTMKMVFNFLELKPLSKKHLFGFYKNVKKQQYPTHPNIRKPFDKKIIGKGLKKMSEKDKKIFKKIIGGN